MTDILVSSGIWSNDNMLWIMLGAIAIVAILAGSITSVFKTRARERTKREIAAYVAEGSIDPKDAVKMLKAAGRSAAEEDEEDD